MVSKKKTENELIQSIYKFYKNHREQCDEEYELAMKRGIGLIRDDNPTSSLQNQLVKVSIVILTANKFETNILHTHVYQLSEEKIERYAITLFNSPEKHNIADGYFFNWNGFRVLNIACRVTGSYTIGGCADAVRYCINSPYIYPTAIISFGICFGCREEKEHLCDTIISRKIYPYFIGAKIDGESLRTNDDYAMSNDTVLENLIQRIEGDNKFRELGFSVKYDNYITGEAVVSSRDVRDKFIGTTTQEIYAGDMEAYGLYKECQNAYRHLPCIVVKSICDWGIAKNLCDQDIYKKVIGQEESTEEIVKIKDKLQALSAAHSFIVLQILIKESVFEKSIYSRIKKSFLSEEHEHLWTKDRIQDVAKSMSKEIHCSLGEVFVEKLCENFVEEGIAYEEEKYIVRRESVK